MWSYLLKKIIITKNTIIRTKKGSSNNHDCILIVKFCPNNAISLNPSTYIDDDLPKKTWITKNGLKKCIKIIQIYGFLTKIEIFTRLMRKPSLTSNKLETFPFLNNEKGH